ncbi:DUF6002 family protein [Micromonospora echinospora]|uniref:DUF6002 family protein n=1 Tax=Micromonospora echinospora TaxID=1877 RepID=UPI0033D70F49
MRPAPDTHVAPPFVVDNPLNRYHELLTATAGLLEKRRISSDNPWSPPFRLPDPGDCRWADLFRGTPLRLGPAGTYRGHRIDVLDLTGNPGTMTTKSFASQTMVARAVLHAQDTGRPLRMLTPTSGNKGTALRDALARAQNLGIPGAELVSLVMVVPPASRHKLRRCRNDGDEAFRRRNPVVVADVSSGGALKAMAAEAASRAAGAGGGHVDVWYTLALDNYRMADAVRAFAEEDAVRAGVLPAGPRLHAHAVSSAYGLLGYRLGREVLAASGRPADVGAASYLLVQHLGTPDMVLHLYGLDRAGMPRFTADVDGEGFVQHDDPRFPLVTDDPSEVLDPTFYTSDPPTAPAMTDAIRRHGGGGVVVSRRECVDRFPEVRDLLGDMLPFPDRPGDLREWSLVMAGCGLLNALDRGLVEARDVLLHASGTYWDEILPAFPADRVRYVADVDTLVALLGEDGARSGPGRGSEPVEGRDDG